MPPNHQNLTWTSSSQQRSLQHLQNFTHTLSLSGIYTLASVYRHCRVLVHTDNEHVALYRLWHQLTLKLFDFFDFSPSKPYRVDTFERFVRDFESKLNQLRLVEMAVKVSKEIDSEHFYLSVLSSNPSELISEILKPT